jgi:hypothetical protein
MNDHKLLKYSLVGAVDTWTDFDDPAIQPSKVAVDIYGQPWIVNLAG